MASPGPDPWNVGAVAVSRECYEFYEPDLVGWDSCGGRSPPDHLTRVESGEVVDGDKAAVFADQPKTTTTIH